MFNFTRSEVLNFLIEVLLVSLFVSASGVIAVIMLIVLFCLGLFICLFILFVCLFCSVFACVFRKCNIKKYRKHNNRYANCIAIYPEISNFSKGFKNKTEQGKRIKGFVKLHNNNVRNFGRINLEYY